MGGPGGHHRDAFSRGDLAVDHPHVGHHTAVDVVDGVEDHRPGGRIGVTGGRRDSAHHLVEQGGHPCTGLAGHPQHVTGFAADDVGDLGGVALRIRGGQIDLVEHRNDRQVAIQGQVEVGQRLRFDALRGVDEQHRAFAGLQRAGHLVGEVDMAGGVDQMQHIIFLVGIFLAGIFLVGPVRRNSATAAARSAP